MNRAITEVCSFIFVTLVLSLVFIDTAHAAPFAYIESYSGNSVSVLDTATNTVVGSAIPVGTNPSTIAVHPAGTFVYVGNFTSNDISVISTATNAVVSTIAVGANPRGVAVHPAGTFVYVSNYGSDNVSVIDTFDNRVVTTIPVGSGPRGLVCNPTGTRVYVTNTATKTVSVINTDTNTVVSSVAVKSYPVGIAINPAGTRVYVSNYSSNNVSVIDTATNAVVGSPIAVGTNPLGVAVNPSGSRVYVTNYNGTNVSVIDAATNTVLVTTSVGSLPNSVAVNPSGTSVYVINNGSKSISVIDTLSNTVVQTIMVGNGPTSLGMFIGPEAVNGACGADNQKTLSTQPGNLCTTGAPTGVTPTTTSYTWSCNGNGIGTSATCSASRLYTVTASVSSGTGTIDPSSRYVSYHATPTFTVTTGSGYLPGTVSGTCGGVLNGNTLTTTAVTGDCTVAIDFVPSSTAPTAFSFNPLTGLALNAVATSNTISVSGIAATVAPVTIIGGSYSVNEGAYTSAAGTVGNGDTVTLQQTSSSQPGVMTTAQLTIGGVSGNFWITTASAGCQQSPAWIHGTGLYYSSIQNAIDHAAYHDVVEVSAFNFGEDVLFSGDKLISLKGGFDCAYTTNTNQYSALRSLVVGEGAGGLIVENVIIGGNGTSTGSNAATAPLSTVGMLALPPGTGLLASDLTVSSALGDVRVGANGSFTVAEPPGGGLATIIATDSAGKLVMLGHVDTDHPELNGISPTTTAVELLFLSTTSFILPRERWARVYELLAAAPETATVAGVIATRMAVNPTAVADQDAAIMAAITTATSSLIIPVGTQPKLASSSRIVTEKSVAAPVDATKVSVSVQTANPYGLSAQASLDDLGMYLENTCRIHRRYLVYRTGYIPSTGNFTDSPTQLDNWVQVSHGSLPAVTGVTGVISALSDFFVGNKIAWAPKQTPTISLPIDPPDAKANSFKVYVVGGGSAGPSDAFGIQIPPAELASQPALLDSVTKDAYDMAILEAIKEFILPLLTKAFPYLIKLDNPDFALTFGQQLAGELIKFGFDFPKSCEKGDYRGMASDFIKLVAGNKQAKDAVFNLLYSWLTSKEFEVTGVLGPSGWAKTFDSVCTYIKGLDFLLGVADIGSAAYQIKHSNMYNSWDTLSISVTTKLNPKLATISASLPQVNFTVRAMGVPGTSLPLHYQWYGPTKGMLNDHNGQSGDIITTDKSIVTYTATAPVPTTGTDTVSVDVYDVHWNKLTTVSAPLSSTITFTDNPFLGDWYATWPNDGTVDATRLRDISCYYDDFVSNTPGVNTFYCSGGRMIFDGFLDTEALIYTISGTTFTTSPTTFYGGPWQMTGELQSDGSLFLSFPNCLYYPAWDDPLPTGKPCSCVFTRDKEW